MILDPIGRDEAREMARRELEKQVYQRDKPSWLERAWDDFAEWLRHLFEKAPARSRRAAAAGGRPSPSSS